MRYRRKSAAMTSSHVPFRHSSRGAHCAFSPQPSQILTCTCAQFTCVCVFLPSLSWVHLHLCFILGNTGNKMRNFAKWRFPDINLTQSLFIYFFNIHHTNKTKINKLSIDLWHQLGYILNRWWFILDVKCSR